MPVYKDKNNTWFCQFYYTDWQGQKKRKTKRGFQKQKDAKEYERAFLDHLQTCPQMTFSSLADLYLADMQNRWRESTYANRKMTLETKFLPYFKNLKICDISPVTIRTWQNDLTAQNYSDMYLYSIYRRLSAIFNYAVKFYGLHENPCLKAGPMGKAKAENVNFWTLSEYQAFIKVVDQPRARIALEILYWCGLRIGELLALTRADVDLAAKTLSISKSYRRMHKKDIITEPKTPKSRRIVLLPDFLCAELCQYMQALYNDKPDTRLFDCTTQVIRYAIKHNCEKAGVRRIRIHDLRHSHASLLIELGYSPLLIAERLGHESVQTTLCTYSHLYPSKQSELVNALDSLQSEK